MRKYFIKIVLKVGDKFKQKFTITKQVYDGFLTVFKDKNDLHTSENFAKKYGFTSRVMHGNILGGFISYFIGECLPIRNVIIHTQEIKYLKPTYLNDELLMTAEITNFSEAVNVLDIKFSFNKGEIKVARGNIRIGIL